MVQCRILKWHIDVKWLVNWIQSKCMNCFKYNQTVLDARCIVKALKEMTYTDLQVYGLFLPDSTSPQDRLDWHRPHLLVRLKSGLLIQLQLLLEYWVGWPQAIPSRAYMTHLPPEQCGNQQESLRTPLWVCMACHKAIYHALKHLYTNYQAFSQKCLPIYNFLFVLLLSFQH